MDEKLMLIYQLAIYKNLMNLHILFLAAAQRNIIAQVSEIFCATF